MENNPIISVLMGVFNNSVFLKEAIESILNQTYSNFEFIIVDDGSTDSSLVIINEFAENDSRIKVIQQDNKGLTKALNKALSIARGQYIARMDGDDVALSNRFEQQIAFMENHKECVCSGSNVLVIDDASDPIFYSQQPLTHLEIEKQLFAGRGSAIFHPTAIIRRKALNKIGCYNEDYRTGQDLELFLRLAKIGQLLNLEQVTLKFRKHYQSTTMFAQNRVSINRRKKIILEASKRNDIKVDLRKIDRKWGPKNKWEFHAFLTEKSLIAGNKASALKHLGKTIKSNPFKIQNIYLLQHYFKFVENHAEANAKIKDLYEMYDYLDAYSRHTDLRIDQNPKLAIGGKWEVLGKLQFEFLKRRGLEPEHELLDLGCGTLRGGRHFIRYLNRGHYVGIDISYKAIEYAKKLIVNENLSGKMPQLLFNKDKSFIFSNLTNGTYDFILAQSVFTHLKPEHIDECFNNIKEIMHRETVFFFTFFKGNGYQEKSVKDFLYPLSFFKELAKKYDYELQDFTWDYPHPMQQNMLAISRKF